MNAAPRPSVLSSVTAPAGSALAALFGAVGLVRRDRPLHPKGVVVEAVLRRTGVRERWGSAWLDERGEDHGLVRLSRSVGLPGVLPDILGLAFSFEADDGSRHDLLLATTGLGRLSRFLLLPGRDSLNSTYTCLFPYTAPRGSLLLAAVPARNRPAVAFDDLPAADHVWPISFRMLVAAPRESWQPFGELTLAAARHEDAATSLRFDPVVFPLPGLRWHPWLAQLREPSYAAARRRVPASQAR